MLFQNCPSTSNTLRKRKRMYPLVPGTSTNLIFQSLIKRELTLVSRKWPNLPIAQPIYVRFQWELVQVQGPTSVYWVPNSEISGHREVFVNPSCREADDPNSLPGKRHFSVPGYKWPNRFSFPTEQRCTGQSPICPFVFFRF
jgi:hypothetical protein